MTKKRSNSMPKCQFLFVHICAGILWNLSSKENLKEKLAKDTLSTLTQKILVPLSKNEMDRTAQTDSDTEIPPESPSETEIFCNATGCLRCTSFMCLYSCYMIDQNVWVCFSFPMTTFAFGKLVFPHPALFCWCLQEPALLQPPVTFDSILLIHCCINISNKQVFGESYGLVLPLI